MSTIRCSVFTDPRYHSETWVEIEPSQVATVEAKTVKLFMAGSHRTTQVTLKNGQVLLLRGDLVAKIEAARLNANRATKLQ